MDKALDMKNLYHALVTLFANKCLKLVQTMFQQQIPIMKKELTKSLDYLIEN